MATKNCIGCYKEVEDRIRSLGIATICESCCVPLSAIRPEDLPSEEKCPNCGGKTNLIGAFEKRGFVILYFDCPNLVCDRKRITLQSVGMLDEE